MYMTLVSISLFSDLADSPQQLSKREQEHFIERQQLAIEFIFCLVITEILQEVRTKIFHFSCIELVHKSTIILFVKMKLCRHVINL